MNWFCRLLGHDWEVVSFKYGVKLDSHYLCSRCAIRKPLELPHG